LKTDGLPIKIIHRAADLSGQGAAIGLMQEPNPIGDITQVFSRK